MRREIEVAQQAATNNDWVAAFAEINSQYLGFRQSRLP
jgi:hypothetical protein